MGTLYVFEMFGLCPYLKFDLIKNLSKNTGQVVPQMLGFYLPSIICMWFLLWVRNQIWASSHRGFSSLDFHFLS